MVGRTRPDQQLRACRRGQAGIALAVDLSARPFYIKGSNHPKGQSFPRLVSNCGLADAIESGIVKIPRLPVLDATGWPDPKFIRLWERIKERLQPGEPCPKCGKPSGGPNAAAVIARLGAFLALLGD